MLFIVVGVILAIPLALVVTGISLSAPRYRGTPNDHFDGSRFVNPGGVRAKGGMAVVKWMLSRKQGRWMEDLSERYGKHPLGHYRDGIRITFVNHSTFLIQVGGVNILTDPVWSHRASPFRFVGPKRMRLPGIRFEDLPRIHLVLISHNHYDHLDVETMRMVFSAHHPRIITPLGIRRFLEKEYISGSTEADWWEEINFNDQVKIEIVPAQHFSGRGLLDRDATLWCGFIIKTPFGKIYFAGDTGYNEFTFKDIGSRCGPMKVSILPVGAYRPAWFMSPIHVSPEEAVMIHRDVESEVSIGMHFGTFPLADDGSDEPEQDLRKALANLEVEPESFILLKEGDYRVFE